MTVPFDFDGLQQRTTQETNPGTDSLTPTLLQLTQYFMSHRSIPFITRIRG